MGTKRHCRCSWKICKGKFHRLSVFLCYFHFSHNAPYLPPTILHNLCFSFLLGQITAVTREIERNAYAKFWRVNEVHYGRCASGEYPENCTHDYDALTSPTLWALKRFSSHSEKETVKSKRQPQKVSNGSSEFDVQSINMYNAGDLLKRRKIKRYSETQYCNC